MEGENARINPAVFEEMFSDFQHEEDWGGLLVPLLKPNARMPIAFSDYDSLLERTQLLLLGNTSNVIWTFVKQFYEVSARAQAEYDLFSDQELEMLFDKGCVARRRYALATVAEGGQLAIARRGRSRELSTPRLIASFVERHRLVVPIAELFAAHSAYCLCCGLMNGRGRYQRMISTVKDMSRQMNPPAALGMYQFVPLIEVEELFLGERRGTQFLFLQASESLAYAEHFRDRKGRQQRAAEQKQQNQYGWAKEYVKERYLIHSSSGKLSMREVARKIARDIEVPWKAIRGSNQEIDRRRKKPSRQSIYFWVLDHSRTRS